MEAKTMLFQETSRLLIGHLMALHLRLKIEGAENVPDFDPAVIICNHRSGMDPAILSYSVRNRYIFYGAAAWSWKIPVYKQFHEWGGAFPLTMRGGKDSDKQLSEGEKLLREGELVGLFPEGGDTILDPHRAEKIGSFKNGFARLALRARVPVIPAAVIGSEEIALPRIPPSMVKLIVKHPKTDQGYSGIIYKRAACRIGLPIDLGDLYDEPVSKALLDLICKKMRGIVAKLYNVEDLDRFLTGETPFDFASERI